MKPITISKANLGDLATLRKGGAPQGDPFYEKNGFVTFDKHIFKLVKDQQTDMLMKKRL